MGLADSVSRLNTERNRSPRAKASLRIGIVGAGFAGIGLAIQLKRAGYSYIVIFEKAARIGGTWRDNTYPGAACDVPSHLYSFSFAPKFDWHSRFASQHEILEYIEDIAERFGVKSLIRFGCAIKRATYCEESATWSIENARGDSELFDLFITAVGQLSIPSIPAFNGLAEFRGPTFHSAAWDHSIPLEGKNIAVIGSAASAVQIVPELTKIAKKLVIFQRTPSWVIPRFNWRYGPVDRMLFRFLPWYRRLTRAAIYFFQESLFGALRTGLTLNAIIRRVALWHLHRQIPDAGLRARLTPHFELGCKRLLLSDDYFPCFNNKHVELVTEPIDRFDAEGIQTLDGRKRIFDLVVFATGFDVRNCLRPVEIRGRGGVDLQERWSSGPEAYRGMAVPGFPNLFLLYGPNTNLGHNSILFMLECQFAFIIQCLNHIVRRNVDALEVESEATVRYNRTLQRQLGQTVWTSGCGNWYGDSGHITANWSGSTLRYWIETRKMDTRHFAELSNAAAAKHLGATKSN
jgi:cation diffusion facilitator CzcD-associated flavoprotein CzcO